LATEENFILSNDEYKFTRFACFLVAMSGDSKKQEVAVAQIYFAALADSLETFDDQAECIDRVLVRDEVTTGIKTLNDTAKAHGVQDYARFTGAGYRGLYNMSLDDLNKVKKIAPNERLLDRMGKTELAANLFRLTQTDDKIRRENILGQARLELAAHSTGQAVRRAIQEVGGTPPERLPTEAPIAGVKRDLKGADKKLRALDAPKKVKAPGKAKPVLDTHVATPDRDESSADD
jgi:DNA-damage-inducible protein D